MTKGNRQSAKRPATEVTAGPAASSRQAELPSEYHGLSLDEIAALLLQLDASNRDELGYVREALLDFLSRNGCSEDVKEPIWTATSELLAIVDGSSPDPTVSLDTAGKWIEKAMYAAEDSTGPASSATESGFREIRSEIPASQASADGPVLLRLGESQAPSPAGRLNPVVLPPDHDADLVGEFITESREYIEGTEASLLSLETDPDNAEAINTVFRGFHTIKGTSAFLGLSIISEMAHRAESLLSRMREREIRCVGGYADLALRSADMLNKLLNCVSDALGGTTVEIPADYTELMRILANPEAVGIGEEHGAIPSTLLRVGDILVASGKASREDIEQIAASKGEQPIGVALLKAKTATLPEVAEALRTQQRAAAVEKSIESSVRVRTDRLDRLIDMIGELVIAQSMISQDETVVDSGHHDLLRKVTHTGKIVRELHDLSMSMRMVPLKATFQKMARLVRDLAHKSGKLVRFETEGEDTEIDRNMVDVIADPLVHMVRNAVDHGIELPDAREMAGKPRMGVIRLSACHSGGNVGVELQDDGKGLDAEEILQKAIAKGLVEADRNLSESEVFNLIFAPGFSTAERVTEVSGRGVGMDVVRRNVEALRGHVEIESEPGSGCTFTMRLPLTLAITDGMLVKVGPERYIIPTVNIHLSFRPDRQSLFTVSGRGQMVMLRGELMPVFCLYRLFAVEGAVEDPLRGLVVVVGDGERRCGMLVDELLGQHQVVAKSLGEGIGKVQGVSGGAILGDGRVGLILDPSEIVALARQYSGGR